MLHIIVLAVVAATIRGVVCERCNNAASALETIVGSEAAQSSIYTTPYSGYSGNVCGLSKTCCSSKAELYFLHNSYEYSQSRLSTMLNATADLCLKDAYSSHVIATTSDFIGASKATMMGLLTALQFQGSNEVVDTFYSYFDNGFNHFDLCDLQSAYENITFGIYFSAFQSLLSRNSYQTPTDESFKTCLKNEYFLVQYKDIIPTEYNRLKERFNLFFRWITALRTGEQALSEIRDYVLTSDCVNALYKMAPCAQCSGETIEVATCPSFCTNTIRGCLVDLHEFVVVFDEYADVLGNVQNIINNHNPFQALSLLVNRVNNIIFSFYSVDAGEITTTVGQLCGVSFGPLRRRRSSDHNEHRMRRQSTDAPMAAIDGAVECFKDAVSTLYGLPNVLCSEINLGTSDNGCWNGQSVGNYSSVVPESDRVSQLENPTLCIRSDTGLAFQNAIAKLKFITANVSACSINVGDCDEKLCGITLPTASNYNLSTSSRYNAFEPGNVKCAERAPYVLPGLTNKIVLRGTALNFTCSATSYPEAVFTWYYGNTELDADFVTTVVILPHLKGPLIEQMSTLVIPADLAQDGTYTCSVENSVGTDRASANYTSIVANIITPPSDVTVLSGSMAVFTCIFEADPIHDTVWQFTNSTGTTDVVASDRFIIQSTGDTTTLTIAPIVYADRGTYECTVSAGNGLSTDSDSAILTVVVAPTITLAAENVAVTEDDSISLTCSVKGSNPALTVRWLKESQIISFDTRTTITVETQLIEDTQLYNTISTLFISGAATSDSGTYTCRTLPYPFTNPILPSVVDSLTINVTMRNECLPNPPCVNGYCVDGAGDYRCVCFNGFTGRNCEKESALYIQHNGDPIDNNGVYLNEDNTVTLQCISNCTAQWINANVIISTNAFITVSTPATYTCTGNCGSTSIDVRERGCVSEYRFCYLIAKSNLCLSVFPNFCCISCSSQLQK